MEVIIVDMVLLCKPSSLVFHPAGQVEGTHLNRYLVNMHALLDTKLRYNNVKGGIQEADDFSLTNHRAIALRQITDHQAEIQVGGLFLSELGHVLLAVKHQELSAYLTYEIESSTYMLQC